MEVPADEQVKKHGATVLLFLLLSLLATGPNWGSAQSASTYGAKEFDSRCGTFVHRAASDKSKPDQPEPPFACTNGPPAGVTPAQLPAAAIARVAVSEPARLAGHHYQARAPPAG